MKIKKLPVANESLIAAAKRASQSTGLPYEPLERDLRRGVQAVNIAHAKMAKERALKRDDMNAYRAWLVKEARYAAGLSQKELAKLVGTHQPAIARLEDEKYDADAWGTVMEIARALGMKFTPPTIAVS
jgi:DNA-binding XRE family transcriptional regulator